MQVGQTKSIAEFCDTGDFNISKTRMNMTCRCILYNCLYTYITVCIYTRDCIRSPVATMGWCGVGWGGVGWGRDDDVPCTCNILYIYIICIYNHRVVTLKKKLARWTTNSKVFDQLKSWCAANDFYKSPGRWDIYFNCRILVAFLD